MMEQEPIFGEGVTSPPVDQRDSEFGVYVLGVVTVAYTSSSLSEKKATLKKGTEILPLSKVPEDQPEPDSRDPFADPASLVSDEANDSNDSNNAAQEGPIQISVENEQMWLENAHAIYPKPSEDMAVTQRMSAKEVKAFAYPSSHAESETIDRWVKVKTTGLHCGPWVEIKIVAKKRWVQRFATSFTNLPEKVGTAYKGVAAEKLTVREQPFGNAEVHEIALGEHLSVTGMRHGFWFEVKVDGKLYWIDDLSMISPLPLKSGKQKSYVLEKDIIAFTDQFGKSKPVELKRKDRIRTTGYVYDTFVEIRKGKSKKSLWIPASELEAFDKKNHEAWESAQEILDRWYPKYYKDEYTGESFYTQSVGMIMKYMTQMLLKGITPFYLEWAMNILGQDARPISDYSIQYALSVIRREEHKNSTNEFRINDTRMKEYGDEL